MQKDKYTDFDLELRSMLQNAEEEVPSQLWDALSADLDRRDRSKVVTLWWRRAAVGVAAAAALAGVFVSLDHGRGISSQSPVEVVAQNVTPESSDDSGVFQTIEEQIQASSAVQLADVQTSRKPALQSASVPSAVAPAESFLTTDQQADAETVPAEEYSSPTKEMASVETKENKQDLQNIGDILDRMELEEMHKVTKEKRGFALFVEGNAASNDKEADAITGPHRTDGNGKPETGISEKSISTFGVPLTFGIGARYDISDRWAVGTGINWSLLSRSFSGIYTEVDDRGAVVRSVNSDITNEIHYIGIPLNFYYNILSSNDIRFYTWFGGEVEKGLVNRYRIFAKPQDIIYTKGVEGLQWSTAVGLGLEFNLSDKLGLFIDPSARYYFDCDQPNSVRSQRPYMMNLEVGLRLDI